MVLYMSYKRDNARRDALHGRLDPDAPVDTSELADKVRRIIICIAVTDRTCGVGC